MGFKNAAKKTEHAAESVGKEAAERAILLGCHEYIRVKIKGPGYGRAVSISKQRSIAVLLIDLGPR